MEENRSSHSYGRQEMMKLHPVTIILLGLTLGFTLFRIPNSAEATPVKSQSVDDPIPYGKYSKPYRNLLATPVEFNGPGREKENTEVAEVRIGVFGPTKGTLADAGESLRRGAQIAIDEANADCGYQGKPFKLVFRPDDGPWGTTARQMVKLLYEDKVWAVLGSVDGPNTHIAEQVITKARAPLVAPTASDPSLTQINVPWIFRCIPDDQKQALALAEYIFHKKGYKRVAGLAVNDHYGRFGMVEFESLARRFGYPLALNLKYNPGQTEFGNHLSLIEAIGAEAVVIWGSPEESALFILKMRSRGMKQSVFGSGLLAVPEFLQAAGPYSEGVTVALPYDSSRNEPQAVQFRENFEAKYKKEPDLFAAYAYDGMKIIIESVKAGGLNRIRIRDAIAHIEKFDGATGEIRFNENGDNIAEVKLAIVRDGNFYPLPQ